MAAVLEKQQTEGQTAQPEWYVAAARFGKSDNRRAIGQVTNTVLPYLALWVIMVTMLEQGMPYWSVFPLTILASAFLVRIFILFHDCCHGSFFASPRANRIFGYIAGVLCFTPYDEWKGAHNSHHATAGNLDRRGLGDVWTLTVDEYAAAAPLRRITYRFFRNPFILFGFGPVVFFTIVQRFSHRGAKPHERRSVLVTNLALAGLVAAVSLTIGFWEFVAIQLPIIMVGGAAGLWLFYVQHQFEEGYWDHDETWDLKRSALEGSSYYKLPKVLQWFTGNIGFHHIHHIRPRIPNYHLEACYNQVPVFQAVPELTIRKSLESLWMNLWDENDRKMISFREAKARRRTLNSRN